MKLPAGFSHLTERLGNSKERKTIETKEVTLLLDYLFSCDYNKINLLIY